MRTCKARLDAEPRVRYVQPEIVMSKPVTRWQARLAGLAGVMILATVYAATVVSGREHALVDVSRDGSVAEIDAFAGELTSLKVMVSRAAAKIDLAEAGDLERHLEAVRTRLGAIQSGFADRIASEPGGMAALIEIDRAVSALRPGDVDLTKPGRAEALLDVLKGLEGETGVIALAATGDVDADIKTSGTAFEQAYGLERALGVLSVLLGAGLVASFVRSSRTIHAQARRDVITGLENRLTFTETLSRLIKDPGPGNEVALMLLDIDLFKTINDSLGHSAGDLLLERIARRIEILPRNCGSISRLGGDEFAIVLSARSAYREASNMAATIVELVKEPFDLEGKRVTASMSIGIASASAGCDAETLLKNADIALYAAKAAGRGTFRFFDAKLDRELRNRRELEEDLRGAIAKDELDLHFQPIVDLRTQAVVGCEALARWRHPRHGFVPPLRFIALAEEIGLIHEIGDWIIERACREARQWPGDVSVSINLSSHQFEGDGLVATVTRVLEETGIAPNRIELEITETVLLRDNEHVRRVLADLKALGVRIAIDDFGTGYSSLSYLQRFPVDRIKIDQSFVREITSTPAAAAIVESIVMLAHRLGLVTTAEGVETEAHAAVLRAIGCDDGQGYHFDKPLTADMCAARLAAETLRRDAA